MEESWENEKRKQHLIIQGIHKDAQSKSSPLVGSTACLGLIQYHGVDHGEEEFFAKLQSFHLAWQLANRKVNTTGLRECFYVC